MKKLLIMFLVLGLASLAQAATLELSVDGSRDGAGNTTYVQINYTVDDTITVDVYCTSASSDQFWLGIGAGTSDGSWLADTNAVYIEMGNDASVTAYSADWWYGDTGFSVDTPPATGKWFDVDFQCDSTDGTVYIYLYDETGYVLEDTIKITQVPEPMTILLLGLGGLFLRRRK